MTEPLRVLLVDPSLFTAPYDAALTDGLVSVGVEPSWAVRPTRPGDRQEIALKYTDPFFYRRVDQLTAAPAKLRALLKGFAHAVGLIRLIVRALTRKPDLVHFQWLVVPPLDSLAIFVLRAFMPVVLTVHDTVPFNGERMSFLQNLAFDLPIRLSDAVIVHTQAGREALRARGIAEHKLFVIPHGPLPLHESPSPKLLNQARDPRYTFVLFGEIKAYKGVDLLVEALAELPRATRERARVIIAGRPRMDLLALRLRIAALELESMIEIRAGRLSEQEMADLFALSDCFLFPYRQIDASGVYFLVKSLGKWLIASRVGVFAEDVVEGEQGALTPPGDIPALSAALAHAIDERPKPRAVSSNSAWAAIGAKTRELYQATLAKRALARAPKQTEAGPAPATSAEAPP